MSGFSVFLLVVAYLAAVHALAVPLSAWVAADRAKWYWFIGLVIPFVNIIVLAGYAVGVLPLLIPAWRDSLRSPFRLGGEGGHTARQTRVGPE